MDYKDLTINKWLEIRQILKDGGDDIEIQARIIGTLFDMTEDEVLNLPIKKYQDYAEQISFLQTDLKPVKHPANHYVLNGHKYKLVKDTQKLTAGQYIDYQTLAAMEDSDEHLADIIGCFLVPADKEYGEYDVMENAKEIGEYLSIEEGLGICYFFQRRSFDSINSTLIYLELIMKRMSRKEKNPEIQEKLKELIPMMKEYRSLLEQSGFGHTQSQQ